MLQHRAGIRFWFLCMYEQYNNMRVIGFETLACIRIRIGRCGACWNAAILWRRVHVRISAKLPKEPAAYQLPVGRQLISCFRLGSGSFLCWWSLKNIPWLPSYCTMLFFIGICFWLSVHWAWLACTEACDDIGLSTEVQSVTCLCVLPLWTFLLIGRDRLLSVKPKPCSFPNHARTSWYPAREMKSKYSRIHE